MERSIRAESTSPSDMRVPRRRWLVPLLATAAYPLLLSSYSAIAHAANDGAASQKLLLYAAAVMLMIAVFAVPCLALGSLIRLEKANGAEMLFLRRLLHVAVATPPVYVLALQLTAAIGVRRYLYALWCASWILLAAVTWCHLQTTPCTKILRTDSIIDRWIPALRVAHGTAALMLLLVFLAAHLANHLAALWGVEAHQSLMKLLQLWYRATWVEPMVLGLCVVMIATGLVLVGFHTRRVSDRYRTIQTTMGVYLVTFMLAHTNTILFARRLDIEPDWLFASGGPAGLFLSASYFVIPYYPLAVIALFIHIGLGIRIALLGHRIRPAIAVRAAYAKSWRALFPISRS